MERVSKRAVNVSKEALGMPIKGSLKKKGDDGEKKRANKEDDPMADGSDSEHKSESDGEEDDGADEVAFETKVQFTEKVRRLTNEGLTRLVKQVKALCPDALEDVDDEKLHIQVDKIDRKNFEKLDALVEENLKKSSKSAADDAPPKKR